MKHTIISWDCSFRNFFHLIDACLWQDYPIDEFELIYVEQRTRELAARKNHDAGFKSLEDREKECQGRLSFRVIYLGDDLTVPYHLGRCNNRGITEARGDIISVMDGDQVLPCDFLKKLTVYYDANPNAILNVHRKMCEYPVGVRSFSEWSQSKLDFNKLHWACAGRFGPIPHDALNIGPMISARREFWTDTGGYDPAGIWGTVLSKGGTDVCRRLEVAANQVAINLPNSFALHPWHPKGGGLMRSSDEAGRFFSLQDSLIEWSMKKRLPHWRNRSEFCKCLCEQNKAFIKNMLQLGCGSTEKLSNRSLAVTVFQTRMKQLAGALIKNESVRSLLAGRIAAIQR